MKKNSCWLFAIFLVLLFSFLTITVKNFYSSSKIVKNDYFLNNSFILAEGETDEFISNSNIDFSKYPDAEEWNFNVGDAAKQIGGATALTHCELVEGSLNAVSLGGINSCKITPKSPGTIIIKHVNNWGSDPIRKYYKIVVTEPSLGTEDKPIEMDPNYKYAKIKDCNLGNVAAGVVEYNGNTFCVTSDKNYKPNVETTKFKCDNSLFKYEIFTVSFSVNGPLYKGFGCRRPNIDDNDITIPIFDSCNSLLGDPTNEKMPAFYVTKFFSIMKYIAIILLIVMSTFDFIGAVGANNEDSIKKATSKTITRLILCVVIFLLPELIEFVLKYLNDRAIDLCGL